MASGKRKTIDDPKLLIHMLWEGTGGRDEN